MNLEDNWVKEVVSTERIITETKLCFKVTFIDSWNRTRTKEVMNIENFKDYKWRE